MTNPPGKLIATASSLDNILAHDGRAERGFAALDKLTQRLIAEAIKGKRLAKSEGDGVALNGLSDGERELVAQQFDVSVIEARGGWFLPESVALNLGLLNLLYHFKRSPRYASGIAADERQWVNLQASPEGVYIWSVLEPFFRFWLAPLRLRGDEQTKGKKEKRVLAWKDYLDNCAALGKSPPGPVEKMKYGGGWSKLRSAEQLALKTEFINSLSIQVQDIAQRFRALRIQELAQRYFGKAKRTPPKRTAVISAAFKPTIAAYFQTDWLYLLSYLGAEPHPDEEIVTALPPTRLHVAGAERAAQVAAQTGLSVEQVTAVLGSQWDGGVSPVQRRVEVFRRYWSQFEKIHASQRPGMGSLWGLVGEEWFSFSREGDSSYRTALYNELLDAQLLSEIESLWATTVHRKHPLRLTSEPFPHAAMAKALGPALEFWQGVALTAWFICETGYSRTDIKGMRRYYERPLSALSEYGVAPEDALFSELLDDEKRLGRPKAIEENVSKLSVAGLELSLSMSTGNRRDGFERLRATIDRHRREWTARHFESYLKARWEGDLDRVAKKFARRSAERGRDPTLKQFAGDAEEAARNWFGGDLSLVYQAIGQSTPGRPSSSLRLPTDRLAFGKRMYERLSVTLRERGDEHHAWNADRLVPLALAYVRALETSADGPAEEDVNGANLAHHGSALAEAGSELLGSFTKLVVSVLGEFQPPIRTPRGSAER